MKDVPMVTVAIVSFGQREYIFECLDSVIMQDYPYIEIVVCNDSTEDFICSEIEDYIIKNKGSNIKNYKVTNNTERMGTVRNANLAFSLSNGLFVKLLAADDCLYDENTISLYVSTFEKEDANVISGVCYVFDAFGTLIYQYPSKENFKMIKNFTPIELFDALAHTNIVHTPGVAMRKSFYEKMGGFDEKYFLIEDWPMWLKISRLGYKIHTVNGPVVRYRMGGVSNSDAPEYKKFKQECWKDYFPIYKNEILNYKQYLKKRTLKSLMISIQKLKILYVRDFYYDEYSKTKKIIFRISEFVFCTIMALIKKYNQIKQQIKIKNSFSLFVASLMFFLIYSYCGGNKGEFAVINYFTIAFAIFSLALSILNTVAWCFKKIKTELSFLLSKF